jgi:hypothetical protein
MTLATIAHAALNGIFREKDPDVVGRFFAEPFVEHDVTLADGLPGLVNTPARSRPLVLT